MRLTTIAAALIVAGGFATASAAGAAIAPDAGVNAFEPVVISGPISRPIPGCSIRIILGKRRVICPPSVGRAPGAKPLPRRRIRRR